MCMLACLSCCSASTTQRIATTTIILIVLLQTWDSACRLTRVRFLTVNGILTKCKLKAGLTVEQCFS